MRFKNAQLEDLPETVQKATRRAIDEDKSILMYGPTGTGKTYALHAIANRVGRKPENFVEMLVEYRDYIQRGIYHEKVKELVRETYLFIDDIGAEKTSEFVTELLYLIVNKRYENMKRTVFTTNLTIKQIAERYGDRTLSRLTEMCVLVELDGKDRRVWSN